MGATKPVSPRVTATCNCRSVAVVAFGPPITAAACYCDSCVCTRFAPDAKRLPVDVPQFESYPLRFIAALIWAKLGMWFNPARGV